MTEATIYDALADAFAAEGVKRIFCLTGDGNMHWEASLVGRHGVQSLHVRHEHTACAMATAWARTTGEVGIASVTCGPGLTQTMTALATAAQARIPLVVFAGEDPMGATWYNQRIDQAPLVTATGTAYVPVRSPKVLNHAVLEAFTIARTERRPVVLAVPLDLQKQAWNGPAYIPSHRVIPAPGRALPQPDQLDAALARIRAAERIVIVAGRGAVASGCKADCERLADLCDAALCTTLVGKGLFEGHPRDIGLAGGYAHELARKVMAEADLVIAIGASLSQFTSDQNALFRPAAVLQIDSDPTFIKQGQIPAGSWLIADAMLALQALNEALAGDNPRGSLTGWDVTAAAQAVRDTPVDSMEFPDDPDGLDPRAVAVALTRHGNPEWAHVTASGHNAFFASNITGRPPERFLSIREFGAIGNGLSYAIGRWAAEPERPVMLTEGDGGFMMHVQELEAVARHRMRLLICIFNDGAYGSEIHKLRADGMSDKGAIYGFGDLAAVARGFGLQGHIVTDLTQLPDLLQDFDRAPQPTLLDIRISDKVIAPTMRRGITKS